jgi:Domain of unknown function (DUF4333)
VRRRIVMVGLALTALVLVVGGALVWYLRPRYLDTDAVATRLTSELSAQYREKVTVACDRSVRKRSGERFSCTAVDARGTGRTVTVTVLDSSGRYRWELPPGP